MRESTGEYPKNWPEIAKRCKERAGWKCERWAGRMRKAKAADSMRITLIGTGQIVRIGTLFAYVLNVIYGCSARLNGSQAGSCQNRHGFSLTSMVIAIG